MAARKTAKRHKSPNMALAAGLGRAFGGALIFSLPLLMTQEMWDLGHYMDRYRLLLLVVLSLPLLFFLSHYSGFEKTPSWKEDVRDVIIACGIGLLTSGLVLSLLTLITPDISLSDAVGKMAVQMGPAALGALLGRSQLAADTERPDDVEETYGGELGVMAIGALFLGLNVAPTEEMVLISYRMTPAHTFVLIPVSLLIMHGFVFAAAFKGGSELHPDTPWWSAFMRFTLVGYVLTLLICLYVLWTFGRLDGLDPGRIAHITIVLGFPAAIGAAAARLII
jgi:putative integral membrane protein (TIGR02587 family)